MLSTPEKQGTATEARQPAFDPEKEPAKRRVHRKKPGRRGKLLVLLMALLVLGHIGLSGFLSFSGNLHPWLGNLEEVTLWIAYGLVTAVVLLCLIRLYRGSVSLKHLIGGSGVVAAFMFAILVTVGMLHELPPLWILHDSLGFFTGAFAAWTCLYSRTASRFLALQSDKPR